MSFDIARLVEITGLRPLIVKYILEVPYGFEEAWALLESDKSAFYGVDDIDFIERSITTYAEAKHAYEHAEKFSRHHGQRTLYGIKERMMENLPRFASTLEEALEVFELNRYSFKPCQHEAIKILARFHKTS